MSISVCNIKMMLNIARLLEAAEFIDRRERGEIQSFWF